MAIRRMFHLCFVQLKELFLNPTTYMFICLLFVYNFHLNADAVRLQQEIGIQLNSWGYTVGVFSTHTSTLVFGLGCVAVFSDLPLIRENALLESTRCSRNAWIGGRIIYIAFVSIIYALIAMVLCLLTCGGNLAITSSWGKLLNTMARGFTFGDHGLPISVNLSYTSAYTPCQAFLITLCMCIGSGMLLGLVMLGLSLCLNHVASLLSASLIAILDFVIYEKLPYWCYRISPFSYTRMSIVANPDMPYYPTLQEAVWGLTGAIIVVAAIAVTISHHNTAFSKRILNEQY